MKYISSQQDTTYFHWQIETYLRNFESKGIDLKDCIVILCYVNRISDKALELQRNYDANFHFYKLDNKCFEYIASVKPFGLWQYFKEHDFNDVYFLHDADIIFNEKIDFSPLINDNTIYFSKCLQVNETSYIDLKYLSQFKGIIDSLKNIMKVEPKEIGGGAQYILKGLNADYFEKYYYDCFEVYEALRKSNTKVQIWCAEMWACLWNFWYFGKETDYSDLLDFCMARDKIEHLKPIVHNAGVVELPYFKKSLYTHKYPPHTLNVPSNMCNYVYYQEVRKIHYIREKDLKMGKIRFIKEGVENYETKHIYKLGEQDDLGKERNEYAVSIGVAEWVETEKVEVEPKTEKKERKPRNKK